VAATFLHVGFNFEERPEKVKGLIPIFNEAIDWVRYAPNSWILWTDKTPLEWYNLLKPHVHRDDSIFICVIDIKQRSGWLPKVIWDWINKPRN
jgi:hypothetical protein